MSRGAKSVSRERKFILLLLLACVPAGVLAQDTPAPEKPHSVQRIYLQDGSYQVTTEYHLMGDHVHYFSAERAAWEDIPLTLVDMPRTTEWNSHRDKLADEKKAARAAERSAADAGTKKQLDVERPEVAPGLRLPDRGYFWGLDVFQGKPELIPMVQPAAEAAAREKAHAEFEGLSKKERKNPSQTAADAAKAKAYMANAAVQPPLQTDAKKGGSRDEVRLKGTSARRGFHVTGPVFYLRVGTFADPHFLLERMERDFKHQERVMAAPSADALEGGSGKGFAAVNEELMPGGKWLKITIPAELPIGEYALVRILSSKQWDGNVWDFAVNPRTFENEEAVTAERQ